MIDRRSAEVPSYQRIARVEVWRGELPKTTTMKVQCSRLRHAILAGRHGSDGEATAKPAARPPAPEPTAPLGETERWMLDTVARLTRTRADVLSPSDRLDDLGVDSLTRVELVAEIEERLDRRLSEERAAGLQRVRDLFELAS